MNSIEAIQVSFEDGRLGQHREQALQALQHRGDVRRVAGVCRVRELVDVDANALEFRERRWIGDGDPGYMRRGHLDGRRCDGAGSGLLARQDLRHGRGDKAAHGRSCGHSGLLDRLALLDGHAHGNHGCLRCLSAHGRTSTLFGIECVRENGGAATPVTPGRKRN